MASIRRQGQRYEIRECVSTDRGPRQLALASFTGELTPEILDAAEDRASRPFDRAQLVERARRIGVPIVSRRRHPEARALLARLRRGDELDATLVHLLRTALDGLASRSLPDHLAAAADWVGQPERERGAALRGLVRTADRILRSRAPLRMRDEEHFPRFHSDAKQAS